MSPDVLAEIEQAWADRDAERVLAGLNDEDTDVHAKTSNEGSPR